MGYRCAGFSEPIKKRLSSIGSGRDVQPQPAGGSPVRVTQTLSPIFNKLYYTIPGDEVKTDLNGAREEPGISRPNYGNRLQE
jgi:hypothetical protein